MIPLDSSMTVREAASLRDAVQAIDEGKLGIAFVLRQNATLAGVLTDYDVRKALLSGHTLDEPVTAFVNREPIVARASLPADELYRILRLSGKAQLPLLDGEDRLVGVETLSLLMDAAARHDHAAVIMAGGPGSRLYPLTADLPKPMIRIQEKPLLQIIMEELRRYGFRKIFVALNYRGEMIAEYFGDGRALDLQIEYLQESEPLGTAGALRLLPRDEFTKPFVVMNGDLLTRVSFTSLLRFHAEAGSKMTVCVRKYGLDIPYGVIETQDGRLTAIREKPQTSCFINAGIYVLDPSLINRIPEGRVDMTDLISTLIPDSEAASFPIHEYWLDIGRHLDLQQARNDYERHF